MIYELLFVLLAILGAAFIGRALGLWTHLWARLRGRKREPILIRRVFVPQSGAEYAVYDDGSVVPSLGGGATNEINLPGYNLAVVVTDPATPASGDPVRFGSMTGVAMLDEGDGGAGATETVCYFGPGVFEMTVDDNEGTGIAVGDPIYYHDTETGNPAVNLNNTATSADGFFGYALETVGANATTAINVLHVPIGHITTTAGEVTTGQIADDAVTSAKVEPGLIQYQDTQLSAAQVKALAAANIEVVPAPGAGLAAIPVAIHLFLDHGGTDFVQVNATDHLALKYDGSTELFEIGSQAQCTAFLEASADAALFYAFGNGAAAGAGFVPEANKAVDIDNNGAAEYTTGDGTVSVRVWYMVVPMAAFT